VAAREASERGEPERAAASYRDLLARDPKQLKARNNLALILDARGDREGALAELDRALESEPDNPALLLNRRRDPRRHGALCRRAARLATAAPCRPEQRRSAVQPRYRPHAPRHLGEGTEQLQRAVEVEPGRAAAWYYLGEALNHMTILTGALAAYEKSGSSCSPRTPKALYGIGQGASTG